MRPRTTSDLIRELESEPHRTALVVRRDHDALLVWADDANRVEVLRKALADGGVPIGIVSREPATDRAFCEWAGDLEVEALLRSLSNG